MYVKLLAAATAAGPVLTDSTAETVLGSHEFPANWWTAGKVVKARAVVRTLDDNSTNTLTIRARFGAAALTGTVVGVTAAVDQSPDDVSVLDIELVCRSPSDSEAGVVVGSAIASDPDGPGTAKGHAAVVTALDLTASTVLAVTGAWSAAHEDNQCQLESLTLYEA